MSYTGDRIGLYHPSVTAPGVGIVSTGTTGILVTSPPGGTASADGTSMASPHVAGVAALMLQKRPSLTPDEVKSALQVTASLIPDEADPTRVQPFWQSGYGYVDAKAAVDLVGRQRYSAPALARMQQRTDTRVLNDRDYKVLSTDYWTFLAAPATVNGTPDTKDYPINVTSTTKAVKAIISYPSTSYLGINLFDYHLTLYDAAGSVVADSGDPSPSAGTSQFFVDLTNAAPAYGIWTMHVSGNLGAQDQDTLMGIRVTLAVSQLTPQTRISPTIPAFTPLGTTAYYMQPGPTGTVTSPEGCNLQAGAPVGGLTTSRGTGSCQSGSMGYVANYAPGVGVPASFTSAALAQTLTVGGAVTLKFYLTDPAQPAWQIAQNPRLTMEIDAIDSSGNLVAAVASGEWHVCNDAGTTCNTGPQPVGGVYTANILAATVPAGLRLSVLVYETAVVASGSRTVYGGGGLNGNFGDAGVTLTIGTIR